MSRRDDPSNPSNRKEGNKIKQMKVEQFHQNAILECRPSIDGRGCFRFSQPDNMSKKKKRAGIGVMKFEANNVIPSRV